MQLASGVTATLSASNPAVTPSSSYTSNIATETSTHLELSRRVAEKDNEARVQIAGRMFPVLLSGLDMLENEQCSPGSQRVVICGILRVIFLALERLQQLSTLHSGRMST